MKKKSAIPHFIEVERTKGRTDAQIRRKLLDAGWHIDIVQSALKNKVGVQPSRPINKGYKYALKDPANTPYMVGGVLVLLVLLALFI